jgi:hypothetical protein
MCYSHEYRYIEELNEILNIVPKGPLININLREKFYVCTAKYEIIGPVIIEQCNISYIGRFVPHIERSSKNIVDNLVC